MAHVVFCLNKLDVGSPERICLASRDETNVLIVSFADVKKAFKEAFEELLGPSLSTHTMRHETEKRHERRTMRRPAAGYSAMAEVVGGTNRMMDREPRYY